jgi:hypothetical protein
MVQVPLPEKVLGSSWPRRRCWFNWYRVRTSVLEKVLEVLKKVLEVLGNILEMLEKVLEVLEEVPEIPEEVLERMLNKVNNQLKNNTGQHCREERRVAAAAAAAVAADQ